MRAKAWLILLFLVGFSLGMAYLLQRMREEKLVEQRQETLSQIEKAFETREYQRVVELSNHLLDLKAEFPERMRVLETKARALSHLGGRNAEAIWQEIIELAAGTPSAAEALIYLASAALSTGNEQNARTLYQQVITEYRQTEWANSARAALTRLNRTPVPPTPTPRTLQSQTTPAPPVPAPVRDGNLSDVFAGRENRYNEAYRIQRGDALYSIAAERKTTVELLQKLNPGVGDTILEGQTILVPKPGGVMVLLETSKRSLSILSNREGSEGDRLGVFPIGLPERSERRAAGEYTAGPRLIPYEPRPDGSFGTLGSRWIELRKVDAPEVRTRVAVHGTNAPESLGNLSPENAIRMKNEHVEALFALIIPGTRFTIRE